MDTEHFAKCPASYKLILQASGDNDEIMAGARGHRIGTIYSRMRGILKTEVLPWHKRPVWYNVWQEFPPQEQPDFQRPVPNQTVREILYPEDYVRAKVSDTYKITEAVNMQQHRPGWKTQTQRFVEAYINLQTPGATVEEVLQKTEALMERKGRPFTRKQILEAEAKVNYQTPELADKYFDMLDKDTDKGTQESTTSTEQPDGDVTKGL